MSTIRGNAYQPGSRIGYLSIEAPSPTFLTHEQRNHAFRIEHPANWTAQESADGLSVTIAPEGGLLDMGGREKDLIYGLTVHAGAAFSGRPMEDGPAGNRAVFAAERE